MRYITGFYKFNELKRKDLVQYNYINENKRNSEGRFLDDYEKILFEEEPCTYNDQEKSDAKNFYGETLTGTVKSKGLVFYSGTIESEEQLDFLNNIKEGSTFNFNMTVTTPDFKTADEKPFIPRNWKGLSSKIFAKGSPGDFGWFLITLRPKKENVIFNNIAFPELKKEKNDPQIIIVDGTIYVESVKILAPITEENIQERILQDFDNIESLFNLKSRFYADWFREKESSEKKDIKIPESTFIKLFDKIIKSRKDVEFVLFDELARESTILGASGLYLLHNYIKNTDFYTQIINDIKVEVVGKSAEGHNTLDLNYYYKGKRAKNREIIQDLLEKDYNPIKKLLYLKKSYVENITKKTKEEYYKYSIGPDYVLYELPIYRKYSIEKGFKIRVYEEFFKTLENKISEKINFINRTPANEIASIFSKYQDFLCHSNTLILAKNANLLLLALYKKVNEWGKVAEQDMKNRKVVLDSVVTAMKRLDKYEGYDPF